MSVPPPPPPSPSADDDPAAGFPPPASAPGVPAAPPPPAATSASFAPQPGALARPPRPQVRGAAILVVVGALVAGIGVFLPWMSGGGETFNGTDTFVTRESFSTLEVTESPGYAMLFFGAILLGLGIALYFAGRVLAVAIIAIVGASIALLVAFGMVAIVNDSRDFFGSDEVSFGVGVVLQPIGAACSLAGSIWATSKRRR